MTTITFTPAQEEQVVSAFEILLTEYLDQMPPREFRNNEAREAEVSRIMMFYLTKAGERVAKRRNIL